MPDPENKTDEQKSEESKSTPATSEDVAALKEQLTTLQTELAQARAAQQDPAYIAYLASQADAAKAAREAAVKAEKDKQDKMGDLTPAEFARQVAEEAKAAAVAEVDAVKQDLATKEALSQVEKCAAKYSDFWDYQKEMMALARKNPLMTAEEAYHAAKGTSAPRAPKAAKTEAPTGMATTKIVREPAKGFNAKASAAWDKVFGKEQVAS